MNISAVRSRAWRRRTGALADHGLGRCVARRSVGRADAKTPSMSLRPDACSTPSITGALGWLATTWAKLMCGGAAGTARPPGPTLMTRSGEASRTGNTSRATSAMSDPSLSAAALSGLGTSPPARRRKLHAKGSPSSAGVRTSATGSRDRPAATAQHSLRAMGGPRSYLGCRGSRGRLVGGRAGTLRTPRPADSATSRTGSPATCPHARGFGASVGEQAGIWPWTGLWIPNPAQFAMSTGVGGLFGPRPRPLTMRVRERGRGPNGKEGWWWTGEVDSKVRVIQKKKSQSR